MEFNKKVDDRIRKIVPEILKSSGFTDRKLTDTPTDKNSVVPRSYVTMNGSIASRPNTSVATFGQFYFSTNNGGQPMWYTTNKNWVNGVGSVIA